jgi:hypothetical protein
MIHVLFTATGTMRNVADVWNEDPTERYPYNGYPTVDPLTLLTTVDPTAGPSHWSYSASGVFGSSTYVT